MNLSQNWWSEHKGDSREDDSRGWSKFIKIWYVGVEADKTSIYLLK